MARFYLDKELEHIYVYKWRFRVGHTHSISLGIQATFEPKDILDESGEFWIRIDFIKWSIIFGYFGEFVSVKENEND